MNNDVFSANQPYQPNYASQGASNPNFPAQPAFQTASQNPNLQNLNPQNPNPQQFVNPGYAPQPTVKSSPILTVLTVLFGLGTVIFIVLFVWMAARYADVSSDVEKQIKDATIAAVDENTVKLEAEFAEREKTPNRTFAGPADYGEVSFEYPKTWAAYEYSSASNGGDYGAVFFPYTIYGTDDETINALRFSILSNTSYESFISDLSEDIADGLITQDTRQINGANAMFYVGEIREGIYGAMAVIKLRDKTVILQTDAYTVYGNDFEALLKTVRYNA